MDRLQHSASEGWSSRLAQWREEAEQWCAGRSWAVRAPLLLWLAYVGVRHLADPLYASLFGALTLAGITRLLAFLVMWGSLAAGAWMLLRMARGEAGPA